MLVLQKVVTQLVLPCGLLWLGLMIAWFVAWLRGERAARWLMALLLGYTLAGNGPLSGLLMNHLERNYVEVDPFTQEPFDAVFVLGGGTSTGQNGSAQVNSAGDRVVLAAKMFEAEKATYIVCTGQKIAELAPDRPDPGEESVRILRQLGVPAEQIVRVKGRMTFEEMSAVRGLLAERDWRRVGLITSAWHLPRAMRLAKRANLDLIPLPADFRGGRIRLNWLSAIPTANGFARTNVALREHLARLAGR